MTTRISEYYDVFDVQNQELKTTLPDSIQNTFQTNSFRGFNNFEQTNTFSSVQNIGSNYNPGTNNGQRDLIQITGKHNSPQANNVIYISDNGDIFCYPPNVPVPYWDEIIFRNFDYTIQPKDSSFDTFLNNYIFSYENDPIFRPNNGGTNSEFIPLPEYVVGDDDKIYRLWDTNQQSNSHIPSEYAINWSSSGIGNRNMFGCYSKIKDYSQAPLFLKFDEYRSRSKVIFSSSDKTRNPDIVYRFGYEHGTNEPIKLNISLSANIFKNENGDLYNKNLNKEEIEKLLRKCYWCVEWVYYRKGGEEII